MGIRNGKKTTTRNVKRIGKHSELLMIDPDPLSYAKIQVKKYNEEYKNNKIGMNLEIDFDEKLSPTNDIASKSNLLNIGYLILQKIYQDLKLSEFIEAIQNNYKLLLTAMISTVFLHLPEF